MNWTEGRASLELDHTRRLSPQAGRVSLWWGLPLTWGVVFAALTLLEFHLARVQIGHPGRPRWAFVAVAAGSVAGLVMFFVSLWRQQPSKAQRVALQALIHAPRGAVGAVVAIQDGRPVVLATICSLNEYEELLNSGRIPAEHHLYLPDDYLPGGQRPRR